MPQMPGKRRGFGNEVSAVFNELRLLLVYEVIRSDKASGAHPFFHRSFLPFAHSLILLSAIPAVVDSSFNSLVEPFKTITNRPARLQISVSFDVTNREERRPTNRCHFNRNNRVRRGTNVHASTGELGNPETRTIAESSNAIGTDGRLIRP